MQPDRIKKKLEYMLMWGLVGDILIFTRSCNCKVLSVHLSINIPNQSTDFPKTMMQRNAEI